MFDNYFWHKGAPWVASPFCKIPAIKLSHIKELFALKYLKSIAVSII
jgi:hypothetical protein